MANRRKAALVACSNGLSGEFRPVIERLKERLEQMGLVPVEMGNLYRGETLWGAQAPERAAVLMACYEDPEVEGIFDVSGGDLANEILPWLDFEVISRSDKLFWGYSDLTALINAIYAKTGRPSVLYQVRNLAGEFGEMQFQRFRESFFTRTGELFEIPCRFLRGKKLGGCVAGGNLRCLLKLAGTPYWPDMRDKVLLLEAMGGGADRMAAFLSQLGQMGVWDQVRGVILGNFTQMERTGRSPAMEDLVLGCARRSSGEALAVVKTEEVGHGGDSRAVIIGQELICREV